MKAVCSVQGWIKGQTKIERRQIKAVTESQQKKTAVEEGERDKLITKDGNVRRSKSDKREKWLSLDLFAFIALFLKLHNWSGTNHSFIPDEGHPLLHSVHTFRNLSEVIFANSLLGHAEGAVGTASHTQVSTTAWMTGKELDLTVISKISISIRSIVAMTST